jgi:hypothetical protein
LRNADTGSKDVKGNDYHLDAEFRIMLKWL